MNSMEITFGVHESPFGLCLIGVNPEGICQISFINEADDAEALIKETWPHATFTHNPAATEKLLKKIFAEETLPLSFTGTPFQMKVWQALLKIPKGKTVSYAELAKQVGSPKAVRAVGTACGKNKIAFLIPCHRVLASSGKLGGYRWGLDRKQAILAWESALDTATFKV